jgi:membrane protein DedA with SNARE-associated domain
MSRISVVRFVLYEALSCAVWSVVITAAGFYFGRAIDSVLGRVENAEKYGLAIIVAIAVAFWLWHRWKEKKEEAEVDE